jgi:ATP-dependent protease ClpP protease subunit
MAQDEKIPVFTERTRLSLHQRRILVLDGMVDDDNGTLLATQLLTLADEDPDADAALWIHSPGGSVASMLAIRDIMRLVPCDVATLHASGVRAPLARAARAVAGSADRPWRPLGRARLRRVVCSDTYASVV